MTGRHGTDDFNDEVARPCGRPWTRSGRTRCCWPSTPTTPPATWPATVGTDHELRRLHPAGVGVAAPSRGAPAVWRAAAGGAAPARRGADATVQGFLAAAPWRSSTASWSLLGSHDSTRIRSVVRDPELARSRPGCCSPCRAPRWCSPGTRSAWRASATPAPASRSLAPARGLGPDHPGPLPRAGRAAPRQPRAAPRRAALGPRRGRRDRVPARERAPAAPGPRRPGRARAAAPSHRRTRPGRRGTQPVRRRRPLRPDPDGYLTLPGDGPTFQLWQLG